MPFSSFLHSASKNNKFSSKSNDGNFSIFNIWKCSKCLFVQRFSIKEFHNLGKVTRFSHWSLNSSLAKGSGWGENKYTAKCKTLDFWSGNLSYVRYLRFFLTFLGWTKRLGLGNVIYGALAARSYPMGSSWSFTSFSRTYGSSSYFLVVTLSSARSRDACIVYAALEMMSQVHEEHASRGSCILYAEKLSWSFNGRALGLTTTR